MMSTASSSESIREHILDLTWSLWAELGVSSWTRRHQQWAIDPEPLVLFTSHLTELDRRLRDGALDWCIQYGGYIAASRLRNLVKEVSAGWRADFDRFAATVNAHSDNRWPSSVDNAPKYTPSRRSSLVTLGAPSLIALRCRALFGVSARADILRALIAQPDRILSASDLVPDVNYTKRNIDNALDPLVMAGLLEMRPVRNQRRYWLRDPVRLLDFIGERPRLYPHWTPIFVSLASILDITNRTHEFREPVAMVEASRVFRQITPSLQDAGLMRPTVQIGGADAWPAFLSWAEDLTRRLGIGDDDSFER